MAGMSCRSYNTYKKCFDNLIEFGFVKLVKKSINQYQCNVIALSKFDNAQYKALNKALMNHLTKQSESTVQSTDDIHKPINQETKKPKTNKQSSPAKAEAEPSITSKFLAVYNDFLQNRTGTQEQFSKAGRAGLKKIIAFLTVQVKAKNPNDTPEQIENNTVLSWEWILSNFDHWDKFHQGQLKLNQIESNLLNIIQSSKLKNSHGKHINPTQFASEALQHLENMRSK